MIRLLECSRNRSLKSMACKGGDYFSQAEARPSVDVAVLNVKKCGQNGKTATN